MHRNDPHFVYSCIFIFGRGEEHDLVSRLLMTSLVAFSISSYAVSTAHPQSNETIWKRGIELIGSGHELEGIAVLDSLRMSGFAKDEFLDNYANHVFGMFIPRKADSSYSVLLKQPPAFDTTPAYSIFWKVTKSQNAKYPSFIYGSTFTFRKPFSLVFAGLSGQVKNQGLLQSDHSPLQARISNALMDQLDDRHAKVLCAICIDLNDTRSSPYEYLVRRINGMYDSIDVRTDLSQYGALSLRCHNRGYYWGDEGTYTAYVVFDRSLGELFKRHCGDKVPRTVQSNKRIRFTVTIESGSSVQRFTEAKLQSILSFF
jgi:hypothetical protein